MILEREEGEGGEKERERERERKKSMGERNVDQLPPVCTLTRDRTHNPLVYGMMFQPTEPPGQGMNILIKVLVYFSW